MPATATGVQLSTPRSLAPGASVAPGSFHDGSAASSHGSAASAFNNTRSTAPYLGRTATLNTPSSHTSGVGAFEVSGLPASPGTSHTPISSIVNSAAHVFSPAGALSTGYGLPIIGVGGLPIRFPGPRTPSNQPHVTPPPTGGGGRPVNNTGGAAGGNSGGSGTAGSTNGNQNYGSSPQGTLESGALGNLLYDLLGPASTGVTPGDAGLQVTPVSPTSTATSPNILLGLLALGALAGVGWYYLKERKKHHGGGEH